MGHGSDDRSIPPDIGLVRLIVLLCLWLIHGSTLLTGRTLPNWFWKPPTKLPFMPLLSIWPKQEVIRFFFTLVGGGAFGNDPKWIIKSIRKK